jgi:hypothetical protein
MWVSVRKLGKDERMSGPWTFWTLLMLGIVVVWFGGFYQQLCTLYAGCINPGWVGFGVILLAFAYFAWKRQ